MKKFFLSGVVVWVEIPALSGLFTKMSEIQNSAQRTRQFERDLTSLKQRSGLTYGAIALCMNLQYKSVRQAIQRLRINDNHIQGLNLVEYLFDKDLLSDYISTLK